MQCIAETYNLLQNLDFDFEKCCVVSLSPINVYACLVCGKYFQVNSLPGTMLSLIILAFRVSVTCISLLHCLKH